MPAEAHRYTWRLGRRDRWFMLLAAIVTVAVVVGILIDGRESSTRSATRCVSTRTAGFMGGVLNLYCNRRATALCRSAAGRTSDLPAQCARLVPALRP
jgi:hypothetical protein